MIGELIFGIFVSFVSITGFIVSILALLDDEIKKSIFYLIVSLALAVIVVAALCDYSKARKEGGYIKKIENVKEELTWQDIKRIVNIADDYIKFVEPTTTEQEYYEQVLKRFGEK